MALYDSYQLANSTGVRQYQGSTVPDLVKVSQELQRRYDAAQQAEDYLSRYMNGMQALEKDKPALRAMSQQYQDNLKRLSTRPDQENVLRDVTMMARDLPAAYAPFAQSMKDFQDRQDELNKAVQDQKITPQTAQDLIKRDLYHYKGIQQDPETGQYTGRFQGLPYAPDVDMSKYVDTWLEHALPSTQGYSHEYNDATGKWIIKKDGKVIDFPQERIKSIISTGIANTPEVQGYIQQKQDLGTYRMDYPKVDVSKLPSEAQGVLADLMSKTGMSLTDAMKTIRGQQIRNNIVQNAFDYGTNKYQRHDVDTSTGMTANPYGTIAATHKADDQVTPMVAHILQPVPGSDVDSPAALSAAVGKYDDANKTAFESYQKWLNLNGAQAVGPNGKPASPYSPTTRWYDATGRDVTDQARKWIDLQEQAARSSVQLEKKQQRAMGLANYHPEAADLKKAKAEYDRVIHEMSTAPLGSVTSYASNEEIQRKAQQAYDKVLQAVPNYDKYEAILKKDAADNAVPVGITTFNSKALNTAVENTFNNLTLNLDNEGLKYGTQGLQWASGPDAGKDLEADDYKKVIGNGTFAGIGIDTDGQYKMFFKVGTAKTDSKGKPVGEDILVKMPAMTGTAENLIKEGQVTYAEQILAQRIAALDAPENADHSSNMVLNTGNLKMNLGKSKQGMDYYVSVRKATPSEIEEGKVAPGSNYLITFYGDDGGSTQLAASSRSDAAATIIQALKSQQ